MVHYFNANGIRSKLETIKLNFSTFVSPQIIIITETKLISEVPDGELGFRGYTIFRQDRNNINSKKAEGGGVLIAVKSTLNTIRIDIPENRVEQVFVRISYLTRKLIIGAVYIPPDSKYEVYQWHSETLARITDFFTSYEMLVFGDYNLRKITWSNDKPSKVTFLNGCNKTESELASFAQSQLSLFNFSQYFPVHPNKGYTLDLFFSNLENVNIDSCECTDSLIVTDRHHQYLEANIKFFGSYQNNNNFFRTKNKNFNTDFNSNRNYFLANFDQINIDLLETDWDSLSIFTDVNLMVNKFYSLIYKNISDNVPLKTNFKHAFPSWFSDDLKKHTLLKIKHQSRWKIAGNIDDKTLFKFHRAMCGKLSRSCYAQHLKKVQLDCKSNPKNFYKFVNETKKHNPIPVNISYKNNTSENHFEASNILSEYFASVYSNHQYSHDQIFNNTPPNTPPFIISEDDILTEISLLKNGNSQGPDSIPSCFIKNCKYSLLTPLSIIYNNSLKTHNYPQIWKTTFITPIYKEKGNINQASNYRPIAIISQFAKIFDSIFSKKLYDLVQNLITPSQHGFVKSLSVTTNLTIFSNFIFNNIEKGLQVDTIFLDFSKAFDKICHELLIKKLHLLSIDESWTSWIYSYLINRQFIVRVLDHHSLPQRMLSGVPQGSNMGPLLFLLFINDLPIQVHDSLILILADDCKLSYALKKPSDSVNLQNDLNRVSSWSVENHLPLNIDKCQVIHFYKSINPFLIDYYMSGLRLTVTESARDLGVTFCRDLSFSKHIDTVVSRAMRRMGWLKRLTRSFSDVEVIKILFNVYIKPSLTFASPIWSPTKKSDIKKLESVNHVFLRYIAWKRREPMLFTNHNYREISSREDVPTIKSQHNYYDAIYAHKISKEFIKSDVITSYFTDRESSHFTRDRDKLHIFHNRTNYNFNSVIPRIRRIYNDLPPNIQDLASISEFKNLVKAAFLQYYND